MDYTSRSNMRDIESTISSALKGFKNDDASTHLLDPPRTRWGFIDQNSGNGQYWVELTISPRVHIPKSQVGTISIKDTALSQALAGSVIVLAQHQYSDIQSYGDNQWTELLHRSMNHALGYVAHTRGTRKTVSGSGDTDSAGLAEGTTVFLDQPVTAQMDKPFLKQMTVVIGSEESGNID